MNELFVSLGIEGWKPVLSALLLPPVPLLVALLVGARLILWRRGIGWAVLIVSAAALWLTQSSAVAHWLEHVLLPPAQALGDERIAELKRDAAGRRDVAIVVLGSGREALAPEYGVSNLTVSSIERLRYGLWLSRQTGAPVAFTGGTGHGQREGPSEAEIAARIAAREFDRPLRWTETESRDTRENALRTLALLRGERVKTLVLVTHGWHMPRARRAFEEAAARDRLDLRFVPAPVGLAAPNDLRALRWLPSIDGFMLTRLVLREKLGWWLGG